MPIDLNCDMGESFGRYCLGCDQEIIEHITSANVACGFHASDPMVMEATAKLAKEHGVGLGAHPGYPDLQGFGRRSMQLSAREVRGDVLYQVGALAAIAKADGLALQHVKPHGALYNTAAKDEETARGICEALADFAPGLILVTLAGPGGELIRRMAAGYGLKVAGEAFADRSYTPEGRLTPRSEPGAVIHDPDQVTERCLRMATEGVVQATDGTLVPLEPQTICVHGDNPEAVTLVRRIKQALLAQGVEPRPMGEFV